ncbi:MAG: beta-lactamase family protein [Leptospiraceae bacterium]|nr:beta-lactamase family protein [Leptospiraceae bacterium]
MKISLTQPHARDQRQNRTVFAILLLTMGLQCQTTLSRKEALHQIDAEWQALITDLSNKENVQLRILAPDQGIDAIYTDGATAPQPFHSASTGKLFTAVLIGQLVDEGRLQWHTALDQVLDKAVLNDLFVFEGFDYRHQVTVEQLLSHTAGLADYFGDPPDQGGPSIADQMLAKPDRLWTPSELLAYHRQNFQLRSPPGKEFHYSDTGFVLLGLVIEKITGQAFHEALRDKIFAPLQMRVSYMPGRSLPLSGRPGTLGPTWYQGREISTYRSITVDWAGGGVISTLGDMMRFNQALFSGRLIRKSTLQYLCQFEHSFQTGIRYGRGMMQYRFGEFFPLLYGYPEWRGHLGILATHVLYDPEREIYIVMSFGSDEHLEASFRFLIDLSGILMRIETPGQKK